MGRWRGAKKEKVSREIRRKGVWRYGMKEIWIERGR